MQRQRSQSVRAGSLSVRLRSLLAQLEQSQWLAPEDLARRQAGALSRLARFAARHSRLYRSRLDGMNFETDAIDWPAWCQIPLLTRTDLQDALPDLLCAPPGPTLRPRATSGATGQPVQVFSTPRTRLLWSAFALRDHVWHDRCLSAKLAAIRCTFRAAAAAPEGARGDDWGVVPGGVLRTGPSVLLTVASTVDEQLDWLRREDPDYLLCYPSSLAALLAAAEARGVRPERLREVRTFGEVLPPDLRSACQAAWGVPLVDLYSSQEVGYVALQCPRHAHYHVQSENVLVEVLDDGGDPVPPGAVGRVVVTHLHNYASPLIRYDIGDFAEVGPPCPCGRGLPVLRRIVGRQRNLVRYPDGSARWPTIGAPEDLAILPPLRQFQLVQRSLTEIEARLVTPRPFTEDEQAQGRRYLQHLLGHPFEITFSFVSQIPRGPGGKFEDFRSELDSPVATSART